jgi:hypothetical protein
MRFRYLGLVVGVALLISSPAFASATAMNIQDIWNPASNSDELNVYEIYNALYGTSLTSSADLSGQEVIPDQVFDFGDTSITLDAAARYAGSRQHFGFYQPTGLPGATLNELFFVTTSGLLNLPSQTVNPVGPFGFYLDPQGGRANPYIWFSEEALNGGQDHMIMFRTPDPNVYLMVWADLNFAGVDDHDYNDLVVELTVNRGVIPEPASMVLLGLGMSGMLITRIRKRLTH